MFRRLLLAAILTLCVSNSYAQFRNCSLGSAGFCTPTGGGGGPASTATPATIFGANLVAWYTANAGVYADAGVTFATNGGPVKQWNDQSGNGYNLTAHTVGAFPQFAVNSFNGRSGISWNGANSANFKATGITQWTGLKTGAAFIVFSYDGQTNFSTLISTGDPTATSTAGINQTQNLGVGIVQFNNSINVEQGGVTGNSQSMNPFVPGRFGIIANGTGISTFANGGVSGPTAQANTLTSNLAVDIGCNFITATTVGSACAGGTAAEIVFVNVSPTATQLSNLDAYFRAKWGM